jgi:tRNA(adenine34) deaminase
MLEKKLMSDKAIRLMEEALEEAEKGFRQGEVPVGAVLADSKGRVIARAHNQPIAMSDPTAHAEILALRKAGTEHHNYRLPGCVLVVTLEPCLMCMAAAVHARIAQLFFGASDPKGGAAGSLYDLSKDTRLNHQVSVQGGILKEACGAMIRAFFQGRRQESPGEM